MQSITQYDDSRVLVDALSPVFFRLHRAAHYSCAWQIGGRIYNEGKNLSITEFVPQLVGEKKNDLLGIMVCILQQLFASSCRHHR